MIINRDHFKNPDGSSYFPRIPLEDQKELNQMSEGTVIRRVNGHTVEIVCTHASGAIINIKLFRDDNVGAVIRSHEIIRIS